MNVLNNWKKEEGNLNFLNKSILRNTNKMFLQVRVSQPEMKCNFS